MLSGRRLTSARLSSQRVLVASASITILLATVLLTALWVYVSAAATVGVRTAIASSSESDSGLTVTTAAADAALLDPLDERIRGAIGTAFAAVPYELAQRYATSDSYTLPTAPGADAETDELTVFAWYADVAQHADLVAGRWPTPTAPGAATEVAVHADAAAALNVRAGDTFTVVNRLDDAPVAVRLVGTFQPAEPASWYWRSDPLDTTGFVAGTSFATRGPLLVADQETLAAASGTSAFSTEWYVGPRWDEASPSDVAPVRTALLATVRDLATTRVAPFTANVTFATGLDQLLASVQRALVSNRSMMIVPVLQLTVLAAYTLLLAARLLSEHRRGESALLRARGMSRRQLTGLALRETAVLVVPAALIAPPAASLVLRLVDGRGPFGALGPVVDRPAWSWWAVSGLAALLCGLALVLPALRTGDTYVEAQAARGRSGRRGVLQRAGADVILLVGAVVAYLQLRHYQSPVAGAGPAGQVDPLLVLGPCLALLAAAALSVRLLSVVAAVAQRLAARGSALGPALGAWQVSRRPLRYSGPSLLLVLALGIGAMSTAYSASWRQSQSDQAVFAAASDVRLTSPTVTGAVPELARESSVAALPAATHVAGAWRSATSIGDSTVALVALDSTRGPDVVRMRPDLADRSPQELLATLEASRWDIAGIPLPGEPTDLTLIVGTEVQAATPIDLSAGALATGSLSLALRDGTGSTLRLAPVPVRFDGSEQQVEIALVPDSRPPTYPLTLIGARLVMPTPDTTENTAFYEFDAPYVQVTATLIVTSIEADGLVVDADRPQWTAASPPIDFYPLGPVSAPAEGMLAAQVTNASNGLLTQVVDVTAGTPGGAVPVVLDRAAAAAAGASVGAKIKTNLGAAASSVTIVDIVAALPGTDPTTGVMLLDFPTFAAVRWYDGARTTTPTEWWVSSTDPAATADAADADPALAASVISVDRLTSAYRDDPLGAMTLGALLAGFFAALAFAAVGLAVNLVMAARERQAEFAVLRALGVSRRQILGTLLVEQSFLAVLGVGVGLLIGLVVSVLVVPLVIVSPRDAQIFPPVQIDVPWTLLGITALGAIAVQAALVVLAASRLQRGGLGNAAGLGADL